MDGDLKLLPEPHKTDYAVYHAQGIIDNGGLCHFFENDFPYNELSDAYRRIGCKKAADAIDGAASSFGLRNPQNSVDDRRRYIKANYDDDASGMPGWDDSICGDETIFPSLTRWIRSNASASATGGG